MAYQRWQPPVPEIAKSSPPLLLPTIPAPFAPKTDTSDELLQLEWQIVEETNLARLYPQEYASKLAHLRGYVNGNRIKIPHIEEISLNTLSQQFNDVLLQGLPEQLRFYYQNGIDQLYQHAAQNPHVHLTINLPGIEIKEGLAAVDEAIEFLQRQSPLPPLIYSIGLTRAAQDHVADQGAQGFVGHMGNDGSQISDRINRYGTWRKSSGENIAYGYFTAESNLIGLIIDDGVPDRGHRINIFNPHFNYIGVACGYHSYYRMMCVMDYAGEYYE
ncbi:hypothetical protein TPSD3_08485 [Thioflexithrix psekupsensis]|uniref:SCP domain-containing protein n=1 Tax=Thioflexithrix psekupsensis TaxID=1570016 RepID=A0A251X974_9GAMM|nr:hypothetical protein TPSD3_08485 [Thioflexithrix psekupsensis]